MKSTKTNKQITDFIEAFDDKIEENVELSDEQKNTIAAVILTKDDLKEGLPALLQKSEDLKGCIDNCDRNIKTWQESKRLWNARSKAFLDVLGRVIKKLGVSGNSIKAEGVKLSTSSRTSLEVDEQWLLDQYSPMADALQGQLPDFVKVSLSLDKNKLAAFLKQDDSLLTNNPDKIHTKVSTSTTIK